MISFFCTILRRLFFVSIAQNALDFVSAVIGWPFYSFMWVVGAICSRTTSSSSSAMLSQMPPSETPSQLSLYHDENPVSDKNNNYNLENSCKNNSKILVVLLLNDQNKPSKQQQQQNNIYNNNETFFLSHPHHRVIHTLARSV